MLLYEKRYNIMRIKISEVKEIKHIVKKFDSAAKVYLFGTRYEAVRDKGDVDLLILSKKISDSAVSKIQSKLHDTLSEHKLGIHITPDFMNPFARIAKSKIVLL